MWILATVLGILILLAILLAIPVDLVFSLDKDVGFKSRARVGWLFGLVGRDIRYEKRKPDKGKRRKAKNIKPLLALIKTRGFLQKLFKFIRDILSRCKVHELKLNLQFGLDDPAETGLLFAAITPVLVYVDVFSSFNIQINPDFRQESLRGYSKVDIRACPIQLVLPLMLFAFSPTTIRAIKAMVKAQRK